MTVKSVKRIMISDGIGYINNRGKSKYWGVTVNTHGGWILSYYPNDSDYTHTASAFNFKISENDLANIAAQIYDINSMRSIVEGSLKVHSLDGKFVYTIKGNYIYRVPNVQLVAQPVRKVDVTLFTNSTNIPKAAPKTKKLLPPSKPTQSEPATVTMSEQEYAAKVLTMILDVNLSERTMRQIIAILEAELAK